jgi:ATP-dependent helicase YprA (DUF1998 family)
MGGYLQLLFRQHTSTRRRRYREERRSRSANPRQRRILNIGKRHRQGYDSYPNKRLKIIEFEAILDRQHAPCALPILRADFKDGRINILNCSTTMEMGVDIGSVKCCSMPKVSSIAEPGMYRCLRRVRTDTRRPF